MAEAALKVDGLEVRYGAVPAVRGLSLEVGKAEIVGLIGPNGAGKSTTLRMVMNIIARDAGSISLLGADPAADRTVLRRVGYLPEERGLYKKMAVLDVTAAYLGESALAEAG